MSIRFDIPMALRVAYLSMHRKTDACLVRYGITAHQFVLLALLSEEDGMTQQQLVKRASSDPNTIRAILVLLEKQGLVVRKKHPNDGRALFVTITRKGDKLFKKLTEASEPLRKQIVSILNEDESELLVELLGRIACAMEQSERLKAGASA